MNYKHFSKKEVDTYKLKPEFWSILDIMRGLSDTPFIITSGLRTVEENKAVGGLPNSAHLRGLAVDLVCSDKFKRNKMLKGILTSNIPVFIEIAKGHLHVSIDKSIDSMGTILISNDV